MGPMAHGRFHPAPARFLEVPEVDTGDHAARRAGGGLRAEPRLRGYVLDDQGHLRANVVVFIDGRRSATASRWPIRWHRTAGCTCMQALSGGS